MIIHCHKQPGYTEPVRQNVSSNLFDKSYPVLVLFWKPNQKTKAAHMQRRDLGEWTRQHHAYNNEVYEMTSGNISTVIKALKRHGIKTADVFGVKPDKVYYAYDAKVGHLRVTSANLTQFKKQNPGVKLYDNTRDLEFSLLTQDLVF